MSRAISFPVTRTVAAPVEVRQVAPVAPSRTVVVTDDVRTVTVERRNGVAITRETRIVSPVQPSRTISVIQGSRGATGPAGVGSVPAFATTNKEGSAIVSGAPMATYTTGVGAVLADATTSAKPCIGLNMSAAFDQAAITIQTAGPFELADWTDVTGTPELAAKAIYFLDTEPGKLTTTSPSANPAICQRVGKAVSPTILDLDPWGFIKL